MEREKLESLLIDYIDNKLNSVDRQKVETELMSNADSYRLYEELKEVMHAMDRAARLEPTDQLRAEFDRMLAEEMRANATGWVVKLYPNFYRAAAAVALLVLGGAVGFWISRQNDQQERIAGIEKEMQNTKRMMIEMLGNDQSASQRIQGVNVAIKMEKADDQIVRALVKTMNEDPNSNVRLAALEALSRFIDEPLVKKQLIESLSRQNDPVIQIALIQLMVKMKEKSVIRDLQRIIDDTETMKAVKDEAYSGIMKLS